MSGWSLFNKLFRMAVDPSYKPRKQPIFGRKHNPFKIRKTRSDKGKPRKNKYYQ